MAAALDVVRLPFRWIFKLIVIVVQALLVSWFMYTAYDLRMYPIRDFGMVIHEYDPWFNYRAAEYMAEHGVSKFFRWYDYMSWYPIGRPIGTTTYPGMQMAAYAIREGMIRIPEFTYELPKWAVVRWLRIIIGRLKKLGARNLPIIPKQIVFKPLSVNDICCLIPPWFASAASFFTGMLAYEVTRSVNSAVMATGVMAVIPAHLMRSVGGKFDNEAVAMAAICSTFWLWLRSVRTPTSWPWGILAGFSYIFMVAAWGGYIFVLNLIGLHALMIVGLGRFNSGVHKAYTCFFVVGTLGAIQIPVVNWQPLRSLEQMGPLLVFLGYHVLAFCDRSRRSAEAKGKPMTRQQFIFFRVRMVIIFLLALLATAVVLYPTGYFGPLSARIRGLFVKHTKTGNPLVDSVAEHQPARAGVYTSYLNLPLDFAWHAVAVCLLHRTNGSYFVALYAFIAMHFTTKMNRLILICAPICSVGCAVWCGFFLDFLLQPFLLLLGKKGYQGPITSGYDKSSKGGKNKKGPKVNATAAVPLELAEWEEEARPGGMAEIKREVKASILQGIPPETQEMVCQARAFLDGNPMALIARAALSVCIVGFMYYFSSIPSRTVTFLDHCDRMARSMNNPRVVYHAQDRIKGTIVVDDYLRGYQWLAKNSPEDARIIAWWDYGYQITGIANRTSIADGNTWNHEHIATLGRTLTSPEKKAWNVIRHIADYVLVFAGGSGDDLAKSPHLARIGNSVFPEHCGDDDPKCTKFGFYQDRSPTPMMARSLLYKAVKHNIAEGVYLNSKLFKEVHTTKNGLLRIYQVMNVSEESKQWIADPQNRVCDAPGSWYCVGQYPPALEKLIAKRRNFAQVEDFNKAGTKSAYTKLIEQERRGGSREL